MMTKPNGKMKTTTTNDKTLTEEIAKIQDAYEQALEEEVGEIYKELENKVAVYMEYIGEEWMKRNQVAIESALRSEATTEFMSRLRDIFLECNINVPEEQVDVVDTLATKVDELSAQTADLIKKNAALKKRDVENCKFRNDVEKARIVAEAAVGLTLGSAQKLQTLAEGVDGDVEEFAKTIAVLRANLQPKRIQMKDLIGQNERTAKK